ncbi:Putative zincin peptidase [Ruminococcaceae bacterium YRB3002]|nr:Putative zincin peptidase [Ruminococcaceae bacterium YRB3002]
MTDAEQKRQDMFDAEAARLEEEGYEAKMLTTSALSANIVGPLIGLGVSAPFVIIFLVRGLFVVEQSGSGMFFTLSMIGVVASIVIHELIHGFTWGLFAKKHFKSIAFGVIWEYLTPYCCCKEPLGRVPYILGCLMPGIVLGIIPLILSCIFGGVPLLFYGVFMTVAAGGDMMIFSMIVREKKFKDELYFDHPTQIGLVKFVKM